MFYKKFVGQLDHRILFFWVESQNPHNTRKHARQNLAYMHHNHTGIFRKYETIIYLSKVEVVLNTFCKNSLFLY